jgi:hypothetical protein
MPRQGVLYARIRRELMKRGLIQTASLGLGRKNRGRYADQGLQVLLAEPYGFKRCDTAVGRELKICQKPVCTG